MNRFMQRSGWVYLIIRSIPFMFVILLILALFTHGQPAAADPALVTSIAVGSNAQTLAVNVTTNRIYVANGNSDNISVINGATNAVVTTITVGNSPRGIGVNESTNLIYVANGNSNNVSVINGTTNAVVTTIAVGNIPRDVGVNESTNLIYVANGISDNVSVINGATNAVVTTIAVGNNPSAIEVNETTNRIYVSNESSDTISVINGTTNAVIATIAVGDVPRGIGVNETTNRIYIGNQNGGVSVIDGSTNSVIATITVGNSPIGVAVNATMNRIYVVNSGSHTLSVIDGTTNGIIVTSDAGHTPIFVGVNSTTNRIYITNPVIGFVTVLGEPVFNAVPATGSGIDVGYSPVGMTVTNTTAITVNNTGSGPLIISGISITGRDAADFAVSPSPDFRINAGRAQTWSIRCTPSGLGVRLATLTMPHNDYGADATYILTCAGMHQPTPTPTSTSSHTPTPSLTNTPSNTPTPSLTPTPTAISLLPTNTLSPRTKTAVPLFNGLRGFYFDNPNFTNLVVNRLDTTVDFNWLTGSPDASIGADTFSVRWTGMVVPQFSQPYRFYVEADGGVRLWVNNVKIIDNWTDANTTRTSTAITLAAGQYYRIQLEYYENTGNAKAILSWSSTSQTKQVIPSASLFTR